MAAFILAIFGLGICVDVIPKLKNESKKELIICCCFIIVGLVTAMMTVFHQSWINPITLLNKLLKMILPVA